MRDQQFIRERSTLWPLCVRLFRLVRTVTIVGVSFTLGRWSTAEWPVAPLLEPPASPPGANAPDPLALGRAGAEGERPAAATEPPPLAGRALAGGGAGAGNGGPSSAPAEPRRSAPQTRPASARARRDEALADGLLPSEAGVARPGDYSVRVAAFALREEARAFCLQLTRRGFHPSVFANDSAGRAGTDAAAFEVWLGRFDDEAAAKKYGARLARLDIAAEVVRRPTP